jgi:phage/plasmid-like protein (TIGR03299 family)
MAHELEVVGGKASMFSVKDTPWHKLGAILSEAPSMQRALIEAKLEWEVETWPVYAVAPQTMHPLGSQPEPRKRIPTGLYATVRTDIEQVLGTVSPEYRPVHNADAFRPFEPLVDGGYATIETAGVLRNGEDVWMLVRYDEERVGTQFMADEGIAPYGLITTNHAGKAAVRLCETPVRVVCQNTLTAALGGSCTSVEHRGNVELNLTDAAMTVFGKVVERYADLSMAFERLRLTQLTEDDFKRLVLDEILPLPKSKPGEKEPKVSPRLLDRRDAITRAWTYGAGHRADGSAFEAYSGLVEVLDHHDVYAPSKYTRVESMATGLAARSKRAVLDRLLDFAGRN